MPSAVVVGERAYDFRKHIGADRLVERGAEPSISHHAKFPRPAASLDSAVIRRRIRRPSEPGGDREVRGGYRNRRSRDPISAFVEVPRYADRKSIRRNSSHVAISVAGLCLK